MTAPDRPSRPSSPAEMLDRTLRRADQIRRRRRAALAASVAAVIAVVLAVALPLTLTSGGGRSQLQVVGSATTAPAVAGQKTPKTPTTATTEAPTMTTTTGPAPPGGTQVTPQATPPTATAPTTTATGIAPTPGLAACLTAHLQAGLTDQGGAAGSVGYELRMQNTGSAPCTLDGYPGVSYVGGGDGTQIGAAALRTGSAGGPVTLAPGQSAQAVLIETDSQNYDPSTCQLTAVDGLRIYPPNQRMALYVAQAGQACANPADNVLQIGAMEPVPAGT